MRDSSLLPELIFHAADRDPAATALTYGQASLSYGELHDAVRACAGGLVGLGLERGERVAIYLEKRFETVIASFGTAAAGAVFVPLNPLLKPEQVAYILHDCNVRVLVTSAQRLALLRDILPACHDLRHVVLTDFGESAVGVAGLNSCSWQQLLAAPTAASHRVIDSDMAAILYTSGSTGKPKGVVLAHRNLVTGRAASPTILATTPATPCSPPCPCPSMPASVS